MRLNLLLLLTIIMSITAFAAVPPMVNYQGKLTKADGTLLADGTYSMTFAIYNVPTAGLPLWWETNTSVQVKKGLFSVLLGSVRAFAADTFTDEARWFGVKVGEDLEMSPRQQIAAVPFAFKAAVADKAILADNATNAVNATLAGNGVPTGGVIMWSGAATAIPTGWALCNGQNGTPDLRDRFIVGAGSGYAVGATGGEATHTLTSAEMPNHSHDMFAVSMISFTGNRQNVSIGSDQNTGYNMIPTATTGGNQPHENRPPYYALCFIIKTGN